MIDGELGIDSLYGGEGDGTLWGLHNIDIIEVGLLLARDGEVTNQRGKLCASYEILTLVAKKGRAVLKQQALTNAHQTDSTPPSPKP